MGIVISSSQQIACAVAWYVVTCVIDCVVVSSAAQPSLERDTNYSYKYVRDLQIPSCMPVVW